MPRPVTSVQAGPELTTCRPCETTPKPSVGQADDHAEQEPRRPRDVRLGERPGSRHGEDAEHAEDRGVGAGEGKVEQVQRDEREAGQQQRALERARAARGSALRAEPRRSAVR